MSAIYNMTKQNAAKEMPAVSVITSENNNDNNKDKNDDMLIDNNDEINKKKEQDETKSYTQDNKKKGKEKVEHGNRVGNDDFEEKKGKGKKTKKTSKVEALNTEGDSEEYKLKKKEKTEKADKKLTPLKSKESGSKKSKKNVSVKQVLEEAVFVDNTPPLFVTIKDVNCILPHPLYIQALLTPHMDWNFEFVVGFCNLLNIFAPSDNEIHYIHYGEIDNNFDYKASKDKVIFLIQLEEHYYVIYADLIETTITEYDSKPGSVYLEKGYEERLSILSNSIKNKHGEVVTLTMNTPSYSRANQRDCGALSLLNVMYLSGYLRSDIYKSDKLDRREIVLKEYLKLLNEAFRKNEVKYFLEENEEKLPLSEVELMCSQMEKSLNDKLKISGDDRNKCAVCGELFFSKETVAAFVDKVTAEQSLIRSKTAPKKRKNLKFLSRVPSFKIIIPSCCYKRFHASCYGSACSICSYHSQHMIYDWCEDKSELSIELKRRKVVLKKPKLKFIVEDDITSSSNKQSGKLVIASVAEDKTKDLSGQLPRIPKKKAIVASKNVPNEKFGEKKQSLSSIPIPVVKGSQSMASREVVNVKKLTDIATFKPKIEEWLNNRSGKRLGRQQEDYEGLKVGCMYDSDEVLLTSNALSHLSGDDRYKIVCALDPVTTDLCAYTGVDQFRILTLRKEGWLDCSVIDRIITLLQNTYVNKEIAVWSPYKIKSGMVVHPGQHHVIIVNENNSHWLTFEVSDIIRSNNNVITVTVFGSIKTGTGSINSIEAKYKPIVQKLFGCTNVQFTYAKQRAFYEEDQNGHDCGIIALRRAHLRLLLGFKVLLETDFRLLGSFMESRLSYVDMIIRNNDLSNITEVTTAVSGHGTSSPIIVLSQQEKVSVPPKDVHSVIPINLLSQDEKESSSPKKGIPKKIDLTKDTTGVSYSVSPKFVIPRDEITTVSSSAPQNKVLPKEEKTAVSYSSSPRNVLPKTDTTSVTRPTSPKEVLQKEDKTASSSTTLSLSDKEDEVAKILVSHQQRKRKFTINTDIGFLETSDEEDEAATLLLEQKQPKKIIIASTRQKVLKTSSSQSLGKPDDNMEVEVGSPEVIEGQLHSSSFNDNIYNSLIPTAPYTSNSQNPVLSLASQKHVSSYEEQSTFTPYMTYMEATTSFPVSERVSNIAPSHEVMQAQAFNVEDAWNNAPLPAIGKDGTVEWIKPESVGLNKDTDIRGFYFGNLLFICKKEDIEEAKTVFNQLFVPPVLDRKEYVCHHCKTVFPNHYTFHVHFMYRWVQQYCPDLNEPISGNATPAFLITTKVLSFLQNAVFEMKELLPLNIMDPRSMYCVYLAENAKHFDEHIKAEVKREAVWLNERKFDRFFYFILSKHGVRAKEMASSAANNPHKGAYPIVLSMPYIDAAKTVRMIENNEIDLVPSRREGLLSQAGRRAKGRPGRTKANQLKRLQKAEQRLEGMNVTKVESDVKDEVANSANI